MGLEIVEKDTGNIADEQSWFYSKRKVPVDQREDRPTGVQQMEYWQGGM